MDFKHEIKQDDKHHTHYQKYRQNKIICE